MGLTRAPEIGELDQRVTVQARAAGDNSLGEASGAWVDLPGMPVWAKAQPLRARELLAAAQLQAVTDVRITIRWRADVRTDQRVIWKGQAYDIAGKPIELNGGSEWLELMCVSGVRDGR